MAAVLDEEPTGCVCDAQDVRRLLIAGAMLPTRTRSHLEQVLPALRCALLDGSYYPGLVRRVCRRRFVKALEAGDARAAVVVSILREIYAVEAHARAEGVDFEELGRRRHRDSRPLIDRVHRIIGDLAGRATPKSPLGQAVAYAVNQWSTLILFLDDPRVPLSNAHVERQQRRTAIGRRNFLFAGSDDSARRFAILHTLIVNCDLVGAPSFEYLRDIFRRLADDWPMARIRELLPAAWLADQHRQQQPSDRAVEPIEPVDDVVAAAAA